MKKTIAAAFLSIALLGLMAIAVSTRQPRTAADEPRLDSLQAIVRSPDPFSLVGRHVAIAHVRVERVAGARSFWAGTSATDRVFVTVDDVSLGQEICAPKRGLKPGDVVALDGVLEPVPGSRGTVTVVSWGRLDRQDASALSKGEVFVFARTVREISSSAPHCGQSRRAA